MVIPRSVIDLIEGTHSTTPGLSADLGQSSGQSDLAMVNMTDAPTLTCGLLRSNFSFSHRTTLPSKIKIS